MQYVHKQPSSYSTISSSLTSTMSSTSGGGDLGRYNNLLSSKSNVDEIQHVNNLTSFDDVQIYHINPLFDLPIDQQQQDINNLASTSNSLQMSDSDLLFDQALAQQHIRFSSMVARNSNHRSRRFYPYDLLNLNNGRPRPPPPTH